MNKGCLVLENGNVFSGCFLGGKPQAGELVFNTAHSGYEEMATDPSYYSQILISTAPMQGNYGVSHQFWESSKIWIRGFICLEIQNSKRDQAWLQKLKDYNVPILDEVDTRLLVLTLREQGVLWGAIVSDTKNSKKEALDLIEQTKKSQTQDWTRQVGVKKVQKFQGQKKETLKVALVDFGYKKNILRELLSRCAEVSIFPADSSFLEQIKKYSPDGILLSNGPGDPRDVLEGTKLVKSLLGWRFMFGICMGHQILAQALGAKNYKLKFGHRGSNHPIHDLLSDQIFMSAQNHGYAVDKNSLPKGVEASHINLNDQSLAGLFSKKYKILGVQFHPENHPGPQEASSLFDLFIQNIKNTKSKKCL